MPADGQAVAGASGLVGQCGANFRAGRLQGVVVPRPWRDPGAAPAKPRQRRGLRESHPARKRDGKAIHRGPFGPFTAATPPYPFWAGISCGLDGAATAGPLRESACCPGRSEGNNLDYEKPSRLLRTNDSKDYGQNRGNAELGGFVIIRKPISVRTSESAETLARGSKVRPNGGPLRPKSCRLGTRRTISFNADNVRILMG